MFTLPMLLKFAGNIWVRRAALVLAVLALAYGLKTHYVHVGHAQGLEQGRQEGAAAVEQKRKGEREQMLNQLEQSDNLIKASQDAIATLSADLKARDKLLQDLSQQMTDIPAQVNARTDAQIEAEVAGKTPRELAVCIEQLPVCIKRTQTLVDQDKDLQAQFDKRSLQFAESQKKVDAQEKYIGVLEPAYVALYNRQAPKYRSIKCLWLAHCGQRTIVSPSLVDLKKTLQPIS